MQLLEIVISFGLAFRFVDSNYETINFEDPNSEKEDCNNELEFDYFCYDGPGVWQYGWQTFQRGKQNQEGCCLRISIIPKGNS